MQIANVVIENFRSIEYMEIQLSNLNSLVGSNNSGKSTILKAIDLFFDGAPKITSADHYMHDGSKRISISIEFLGLTPMERQEFGSAVKDGKLNVVREFGGDESEKGEYSVFADICSEFEEFRDETNGTKKRSIYSELRKRHPELQAAAGEEMEGNLRDWEVSNPDQLTFKKVRGFFGARNVANGKLKKKTAIRLFLL